MRKLLSVRVGACGIGLGAAGLTGAAVTPVGPFAGDLSEHVNFGMQFNGVSIPLFDGFGALTNEGGQTAIKVEFSSTFMGKQVLPIDGPNFIGFAQGPGLFEFSEPVAAFGSYINTNSGADDALVEFYDSAGLLIETTLADVPFSGGWTWNGWVSDVPIGSVRFTGNGTADGFLWFDEMEVMLVPAPAVGAPMALTLVLAGRRRR